MVIVLCNDELKIAPKPAKKYQDNNNNKTDTVVFQLLFTTPHQKG